MSTSTHTVLRIGRGPALSTGALTHKRTSTRATEADMVAPVLWQLQVSRLPLSLKAAGASSEETLVAVATPRPHLALN